MTASPAADLTDAVLVARAVERDPDAMRAIMRRYNRRLYRIARGILGNDAEAEDAVQSAYMHAFRGLAAFRGDAMLGTWLTRIVINEALGLRRGQRPSLSLTADMMEPALGGEIIPFPGAVPHPDPERIIAQRQIQSAVERAIDELPVSFRAVLVARVLEEMSVEETAELLGLRPETVKTRLHRARRLLRQALERQIGPVLLDAFPYAGARCERMTERVIAALTAD
jgi:RNA polymerase sigma-70 factor (ECF subfamily)